MTERIASSQWSQHSRVVRCSVCMVCMISHHNEAVRRRRILKYWKKSGVFRQGVVAAESAPPRSAAHTSDPFDASLLADTGTQWCAKRAALCGYFLSLAAVRFVSFCREQDARKVDEKREMKKRQKEGIICLH